MNKQTIYKALRILYNRGELDGNDLKEFIKWKKCKCNKEEYNLTIEGVKDEL